jgi:mycothiol synthase
VPVSPTPVLRDADPADGPALRGIAARALRWDPDAADLVDLLLPHAAPRFAVLAQAGGAPAGFALGSLGPEPADPAAGRRGHVDLLAVDPGARRRGCGRALLTAIEDRLTGAGAARVLIGGATPLFAWPGIDVRYTAACCLAEASGYVRRSDAVNMTVELTSALGSGPATDRLATGLEEKALAARGITVRRLRPDDREPISPWLAGWGGTWRDEAFATLERDGAGCHIAVLRDGAPDAAYVGFACHGVNRADWFGPMGTDGELRGLDIGSVLLRRCLDDLRAAGHPTAQIGWVGPIGFYARTVDAYIERVFRIYRKER